MITEINMDEPMELYAVEHQYSCGGYWIASPCGDDGEYWRMTPSWGQGCVLTRQQVEHAAAMHQSRRTGEVRLHWVDRLPDGARVINDRNYRSSELATK